MSYKEYLRKRSEHYEFKNDLEEITFEIREIGDLSKLPSKLPNSSILKIYYHNLMTIKEFSSDLSNLEELEINSRSLQDLRWLPEKLPSLQRLIIKAPRKIEAWKYPSMSSFIGTHLKLPELIHITLDNSDLQNFANLPLSLPKLEEIKCNNQLLNNFLGFPEEIPRFKCLRLNACDIYSFEEIFQPKIELDKNPPFFIKSEFSKVYSLTGLTYPWFKYIIKEFFNDVGSPITYLYSEKDNSINRYKEIFKLSPIGMKLLFNSIQWDVFNQYFPKFQMSSHRYETDRYPYWDNKDENEWNNYFCNSGGEWIDGYEISDRLFIDENLNFLYEYYKNTPLEIAYQYRNNPNSVPQDQIERLKIESDYRVLKILEPFVPIDDPVLNYLSRYFQSKHQRGTKF